MFMSSKAKRTGRGIRLTALGFGFLFAIGLAGSPTARAEMQLGAYGGWNGSFDSDIHLVQPDGTNITLSDVPWDGLSFDFSGGPPYYGFNAIYWLESRPNLGFGIDYTHAKVRAEENATVAVKGRRDGAAVGGRERVGETFERMEFTDGLNLLIATVNYRWPGDRLTPFVGAGVGLSIPNVEVRGVGETRRTFEYQVTGVAAQAMAGLEYRLTDRVGLFGQYKISYSETDADLIDGGTLKTDIWTNQIALGVTYHLQPAPRP